VPGFARNRLDALERVSLATRLMMLVTVPLLVIALISALALSGRWSAAAAGRQLGNELEETRLVDEAVRALQAERAAAVLWRIEPDGIGRAELRAEVEQARATSDAAIAAAGLGVQIPEDTATDNRASVLEPGPVRPGPDTVPGRPEPVRESSGPGNPLPAGQPSAPNAELPRTLEALRTQIDLDGDRFWRVLSSYTLLIGDFQDEVLREYLDVSSPDSGEEHASPLIAHYHLSIAFEALTAVRAHGVGYLEDPQLVSAAAISVMMDSEDTHLSLATLTAARWQRDLLDPLMAPDGEAVGGTLRAQLFGAGVRPQPAERPLPQQPGMTGDAWLDATSERYELMDEALSASFSRLLADAGTAAAAADRDFVAILVVTLLILLAVGLGAWAVSRSISRPLHRLALTAQLAAVGHITAVDIPPSRDALGEIGQAIEELRARSDEMARSAEAIAGGDLTTTIEPRSGSDRLGWALRTMTKRLAAMVAESEERSEQLEEAVGELRERAAHDVLTGLANRRRFAELLEDGVVRARGGSATLGVLFIDLDGFKQVNDTMGHEQGDDLLRRVADRLRAVLGPDDAVGRFGGDEFTLIVRPGADLGAAGVQSMARRVVEAISMPFELGDGAAQLGASVGVAVLGLHGESAEELLRESDHAMYEAKQGGGGVRTARPLRSAA